MAVDLRSQPRSLEEPKELLLELPSRLLFLRIVMVDRQSKASDSSPALVPLQQLDDFSEIEDFLDFGLGDRVTERVG
jgi:hypothetical protein